MVLVDTVYTPEDNAEWEAWRRHGLPWLRSLPARVQDNMDLLCAVTGEEGTGKSTLAIRLALLFDPDFWVCDIFSDATLLKESAAEREPGSVMVLDEAFDGALNREAMKSENVDFVKWLMDSRYLQHVLFLCFPRWQNLDIYLRRHRVAYRLHLPRRGLCEVYAIEQDKFQDAEPWQRLVTKFRFSDLESHPIWPVYQEAKEAKIRERGREEEEDDPSGLTRGEIKKALREGHLEPERATREYVVNGHVRDHDTAARVLASYSDYSLADLRP